MKKEQLAVQLYSFRDHIKEPKDIINTLRKIKEMGYDAIELSPALDLPPSETLKILSDEGLGICGCGVNAQKLISSPDDVIQQLQALGCTRAVYGFPHMMPTNEIELSQFISELRQANLLLAAAGITLNYHNHANEFVYFKNKCWLETIYDEIPDLSGELDVFWVQVGGASPNSWIKRLAGRMTAIHLKDYGVIDNQKHKMLPVGQGNLEWESIISTAEEIGVEWFVVEHDADCPDPFESFKMSFDYLTENFI